MSKMHKLIEKFADEVYSLVNEVAPVKENGGVLSSQLFLKGHSAAFYIGKDKRAPNNLSFFVHTMGTSGELLQDKLKEKGYSKNSETSYVMAGYYKDVVNIQTWGSERIAFDLGKFSIPYVLSNLLDVPMHRIIIPIFSGRIQTNEAYIKTNYAEEWTPSTAGTQELAPVTTLRKIAYLSQFDYKIANSILDLLLPLHNGVDVSFSIAPNGLHVLAINGHKLEKPIVCQFHDFATTVMWYAASHGLENSETKEEYEHFCQGHQIKYVRTYDRIIHP